jgi:hypothetical protein
VRSRGPSVPDIVPRAFSGIPGSLRGIKRAELYYTLMGPVDQPDDFLRHHPGCFFVHFV